MMMMMMGAIHGHDHMVILDLHLPVQSVPI